MNTYILPAKKKIKELELIANWRNQTLNTLRSNKLTSSNYDKQCAWLDSIDNNDDKCFFVYSSKNEFIGYSCLDKINNINGTAELGLLIGYPFQKKGHGREAAYLTLQFAFDRIDMNCVFIEVYTTSNNWSKFWEPLGFIKEGKLRSRKYWDGKYFDSIMASMLKTEWNKQKELLNPDKF